MKFVLLMKLNLKPYLLFLFVICVPLSLLFFGLTTGFTSDWYNSIWMTGYQRYYFLAHHEFATVFNTTEVVGIPYPIFYGSILYPLLGFFSIPFGPHITMRICIFAVTALEFILLFLTLKKISKNNYLSTCTAILYSWSIYPLTNLYTRSALPEFFAVKLLGTALCALILSHLENKIKRKAVLIVLFTLCFGLCLGTHPITAFYGSIMVLTLFVSTAKNRKDIYLFLTAAFFLVLILSPWLYALKLFLKDLAVSGSLSNPLFYKNAIDDWWVRLFPLPLDLRSLYSGTTVPTPHLDAQCNTPLLLLSLALAHINSDFKNWKFQALFALFIFIFLVSVGIIPTSFSAVLLGKIQILYRWTSFLNIILLLTVFYLCRSSDKWSLSHLTQVKNILPALVAVSFCAVLLRLVHAYPITKEGEIFGYSKLLVESDFLTLPKSLYSPGDYLIRNGYIYFDGNRDVPPVGDLRFVLGTGKEFGNPLPVLFEGKKEGLYSTQVMTFPWNSIYLAQIKLPNDRVRLASDRIFFRYEGEHNPLIEYYFTGNTLWFFFRKVSFTIIFSLLILLPWVLRKLIQNEH